MAFGTIPRSHFQLKTVKTQLKKKAQKKQIYVSKYKFIINNISRTEHAEKATQIIIHVHR